MKIATAIGIAFQAALTVAGVCHAQVTLDGSLGPPGGPVPLVDSTYAIPDSVGKTVGNNLFHSFGQFSLNSGETAGFTGPATVQNILARVTGGSPSSIDGTIDSTSMPQANFFFVNPAGILFGPHAQLNVGGSFVATTADHVKLADGGRFDARIPDNDILTVAAPSAFGFLGTPAPITLQGGDFSIDEPQVRFEMLQDRSFSLIGGNIELVHVLLSAPSGRINIISLASAGELAVDVTDHLATVDTLAFEQLGAINISDHSNLTASGVPGEAEQGGKLTLSGDNLAMSDSVELHADNYSSEDTPAMEFNMRGDVVIANGFISTFALGTGRGGDIEITGASINLQGTADVDGNSVSITTDTLAEGDAGDIRITATESITIENGALVSASTSSVGHGGKIEVTAPVVLLDGHGHSADLSTLTFDGPAGNIIIRTESLEVRRNGQIVTDSFGPSNGGDIDIVASSIRLDGQDQVTFSGISAKSGFGATGVGGNILIRGLPLGLAISLVNGAQISAQSDEEGNGGNIDISATSLHLNQTSAIQTLAAGSGNAGGILINLTDSLLLEDNSALAVSAAQANGGDIRVTTGHDIRLVNSHVTAQAAVDGGIVHLAAPDLIYLLDSTVSAEAVTKDGGNISIDPTFLILDGSLINTSAGNDGGDISIVAKFILASPDLDSSLDAKGDEGVDGTVSITSPDVDLSGNIVELDKNLLAADAQLGPHCAIRLPGGISSFVVTGRGGSPVTPDSLLPALPTLSGDGNE